MASTNTTIGMIGNNNTTDVTDNNFQMKEWSTLDGTYLVLTWIILVVGSIGNVFVVCAVLTHR